MDHDDRDRELPLGKITVWGLLASSVVTMGFLALCPQLSPVGFARGLVQGDLEIHVAGRDRDRVEARLEARHRARHAVREARDETRTALTEAVRSLREDRVDGAEALREEVDRALGEELRSELRRELHSGLRLRGGHLDAHGLRWTVPSITFRTGDDGAALAPILSSELGAVLGPELGAAMGPVIGAEVARSLARAAAATSL
jgi:hypothetical protein